MHQPILVYTMMFPLLLMLIPEKEERIFFSAFGKSITVNAYFIYASTHTGTHDDVSVTAHAYSGKRGAYFFSAFGKSITVNAYFI